MYNAIGNSVEPVHSEQLVIVHLVHFLRLEMCREIYCCVYHVPLMACVQSQINHIRRLGRLKASQRAKLWRRFDLCKLYVNVELLLHT
jgi:hypothetical protein